LAGKIILSILLGIAVLGLIGFSEDVFAASSPPSPPSSPPPPSPPLPEASSPPSLPESIVFLTKWGSPGEAINQFNFPFGIAVDLDGFVYVADTNNHRIVKFTSDGAFLTEWGSQGSANGQFITSRGIAVDLDGNVYVADSGNDRIQKFYDKDFREMFTEEEFTDIEEGEFMVTTTDSAMGDGTHVYLEFSEIHVNYEITATQNGETILHETAHAMEMTGENYHIDAVGSDDNPIDIKIVSLGIGPPNDEDNWTGPTGTVATTQVVPEFGTIAMMVLAVAIISIVAVTAKSRVIPRL